MAKSAVYRRQGAGVEFNMTPMIDVTFQLIIFFILAGQIASDALAKLELSRPDVSQAADPEEADVDNKVLVNVLSKGAVGENVDPFLAGKVEWYQIEREKVSPDDPEFVTKMVEIMKKKMARARYSAEARANFFVEVRDDRRVHYEGVEPVLTAAAEAGISKMNITALLQ